MDAGEVVRALALVMVIEGILPFAAPVRWRSAIVQLAQMSDRSLRIMGLLSMAAGVAVLQFV